ncbi:MAG TPA: tyrosine--tRNA ligase [Solirubrobacteraceae bacterium]|nr:tyrosine--tRNA ligase [Solirubrobacteraceae bacterium]
MPIATNAAAAEAHKLERNAVDSLPSGALAERIEQAAKEARPLRVKLGIDPTAPDIHVGHAVVLSKLREFQDAGHTVVLIIGDYTARVGDPSGRSSLRPILSEKEIERNAGTFQEQATRILDPSAGRLEVRRNSEWLDMPMTDLLALTRTTTVAQLLEREDFSQRWREREPISILELLYPLLQGYDSVAIDADVELGGTDQKFNLLLGRDIQRAYGRPEQAILTMPLLVGTDGTRKMSKTLNNQISITDPPQEIYGRTMSIPDAVMPDYYRLLLRRGVPDLPPRDAKRELARSLVTWLYDEDAAAAAERHFDRVIVDKEAPEEMPEHAFRCDGGTVHVPGLIGDAFGMSRSDARRLIDQGAVTLDERPLAAAEHDVPCELADGAVLKAGKRRFVRLRRDA